MTKKLKEYLNTLKLIIQIINNSGNNKNLLSFDDFN